ncbi:hypothetical protein [Halalkalibacter sp. APA_J-10(15)]|uniref:hypothetical protein n=1 Tax=Halalkalibacter sp. APA_J-10(15) TaxID=2933805 RepID=UPI001FF6DEF2|nr:hypothetical protein [Halalkalibacter sp. APA_J-10(15)]MCK0471747.1 hypothetical protein [Halalkalibacter sp. APA_J-10(15)]
MKKILIYCSFVMLLILIACQQEGLDENEERPIENEESDEPEEDEILEERIAEEFVLYTDFELVDETEMAVMTLQLEQLESPRDMNMRFMDSLVASDFTSNQVLAELLEVTIEDGSQVTLVFSENEQLMSMASTEQLMFDEMLMEISHFYGIDELKFYVEDSPGITYGQMGEVETMTVNREENRGYYAVSNSDSYVSGRHIGQSMTNTFEQTVEQMKEADDGEYYYSMIPNDLEMTEIVENQTEIEITFETDVIDLTAFKHGLVLTAIDFGVDELRLVNDSQRTKTIIELP